MKHIKLWIGLCAVIFIAGIAGSLLMLNISQGTNVDIVQDGNILYSFDLSRVEDQRIEILYEGKTNTVEIKGKQIRMLDAECPDHTCVHMGYLKPNAPPIVCLPNHLVVKYTSEQDAADATVQ